MANSPTETENPGDGNLFSHLRELRSRLIKSLAAVALGFVAAFNFSEDILRFLVRPLKALLPDGQKLIYTGLPDGFLVNLKIGLWGGFFISSPFWLYQLWAFIAPGLYRSERQKVLGLALTASLLLFGGAAFGYVFIFPLTFKFFIGFSNELLTAMPALGPYFSLAAALLLASGLAFQMPLVIVFLADLGLFRAETLRKGRRYAILIIFILAAVLTPPDVVSQALLAVPMLALYEISIRLVAGKERKRAAANNDQAATGPGDL